jgi:beta-mannanase
MTLMGVYVGNDTTALADYENWLGRDVDAVHGVVGGANWSDFVSSAAWMTEQLWANTDAEILWSVPLLVYDGTASLSAAASGRYNDYYSTVAATLLESRADDTGAIYIRTGWELNGDWFPWAAEGHEADYIAAYRQFVDSFRDVSDRFVFEWNVNFSSDGIDPATAYPGDDYVDIVGMDFYWSPDYQGSDPLAAFAAISQTTYGLQWLEDFAAAHGKPTAYSEWGIDSDNAALYLEEVKAWFESHDVVYQSYWDVVSDKTVAVSDGSTPNSTEAFQELFGSGTEEASSASATVSAVTSLAVSGTPNSWFEGTSGHDVMTGTSGNDLLSAHGGDTMAGGLGDDTYAVTSTADQVAEQSGAGIDTVTTWINGYVLPDQVENLVLTGTGLISGTGNALDNRITGNDAANLLDGKGGHDLLTGGDGNDTFLITYGQGSDTITDFQVHGGGSSGDMLLLKGFGTDATLTNDGSLFTVTTADGAVEQFTLSDVSHLGTGDYLFV